MHRRQAIREAAAAALTAWPGFAAGVAEEQGKRVAVDAPALVVVNARSEGLAAGDGTMGAPGPDDRRALALTFDVYTAGATGQAAVDAVNDLDVAIGAALGAANQPGGTLDPLVVDLRWTAFECEVSSEQSRFLAFAQIVWTALYDVYFGDPT